MAALVLHLRAEDKVAEHRAALTPSVTKKLIDAGYVVNVERSSQSVFDDDEYAAVGATLVPTGTWRTVPKEHIIVGLKELPEEDFPLVHTHIQFAHCYKQQDGWDKVLARFPRGGGTLLDLEFLVDDTGRRVAAFGYEAGFAGASLALRIWAWQLTSSEPFPAVNDFYPTRDGLVESVRTAVEVGKAKAGRLPRVIVIGALGRCGRGAVDAVIQGGVPEENILKWDMAETAKGGPFDEVRESDIFVNCIYLSSKIPPFVTIDSLKQPGRNLSVVCDVSADTTNPFTPVPIYTESSTFAKPTVLPNEKFENPPLAICSIDHLPSLLPREASEGFANDLLPTLLTLKDRGNAPVWERAEKLFQEKVATLPPSALEK
ncbi:Formate/glycerate dehydrogenase catalytic domain-like protein [Thozetella sp. PMI_491]|nr:Formate/glycerate dehydrogenase catalytic domain-like protein [Thozetella sp. PMI_491]